MNNKPMLTTGTIRGGEERSIGGKTLRGDEEKRGEKVRVEEGEREEACTTG